MPADYRSASFFRTVAGAAVSADDFGNTPATATVVAVGAAVSGKIETADDVDMFKVQLTAGKLYSFTMKGLDDSGRVSAVWTTFSDASGTVYDGTHIGGSGGGDTNSYSFIPSVSGSYYVGANASGAPGVLSYTFKVSEAADDYGSSSATAGKLDVGGAPVRGTLDEGGGDHDWFAVSLTAGTSYWFTLGGSDTGAGTLPTGYVGTGLLKLFDAAGKEVDAGAYNGNWSVLPFVAPASGTYYLDVNAKRWYSIASGGTYQVQAQVAAADEAGDDLAHATTAQVGGAISGRIGLNLDTDVYKISLAAGTSYILERGGPGGGAWNINLQATLTDSKGNPVYLNQTWPSSSHQFFDVAVGGDYYLKVAGDYNFGVGDGLYTLKLTAASHDDYPASAQTGALLEASKPVHGTIGLPNDADWIRVHLEAGKKYAFDMKVAGGLQISAFSGMSLLDSKGGFIDSSFALLGRQAEGRIVYTATATGDYYLAVHGDGYQLGGDYTLIERLLTGDTAGPVLQAASIASGATGVPITGGIEFTFDDAVAYYSDVVLKDATGKSIPPLNGYSSTHTFDNKLVVDTGAVLQPDMTYTLTLGDIRDLAGNPYAGPKTYTFTTGTASAPGDDYAGNASTDGVLTAGTPVSAVFETAQDVDWFKFHADSGKHYAVSGGGTVTIYDAAGKALAPTALQDATAAGDYYIGFAAAAVGPGAYSASVREVTDDYSSNDSAPGQLAVGGQQSGALQYAGDIDRFKIALTAGANYTITLDNGGGAGTASALPLTLTDPGGKSVSFAYTGAGAYHLVAAVSGTYSLNVGDSQSPPGSYTIAAAAVADDYADTTAGATLVDVGKLTLGTLQSPGDQDVFGMDLGAGSSYLVSLVPSVSTPLAPHWSLLDSKGATVSGDFDGNYKNLSFTAGAAGRYYLVVKSSTSAAGWDTGYGLKVTPVADDYGASAATAGKLAIGATAAGKLEDGGGDSDWFAVALDAGATYSFSAKGTMNQLYGSSVTDAPLRLLDASGKKLDLVTQTGNSNGNPLLYYTATAKGTYYVDVGLGHSGLVGDYKLQVLAVPADDFGNDVAHAAKLADGVLTSGKLETASDKDVFKISLAAGALVTIDFSVPISANGMKLTVTNSSGAEIKGIGQPGELVNGISVSSGQYKATAAGDYYVTIGNSDALLPSAAYTIKSTVSAADDFSGNAGTIGVLSAAAPQHGMIGVAGDADWFKVRLETGHSYGFALQSGGGTLATAGFGQFASTGIDLYAADGSRVTTTPITGTADVGVSVTPVAGGDYFVSVHGNAYQTGSYTLVETATPIVTAGDDYGDARETAAVLTLGNGISGVLGTTTDIDMFKVSLTAGTTYAFSGQLNNSLGAILQLNLMAGDGSAVYGASDSLTVDYTYTPTASGTYYLAVTDRLKFRPESKYTLKAGVVADDYAGDATTKGVLAVGTPAKGVAGGPADMDWFKVHLDGGKTYVFDMNGGKSHGGTLDTGSAGTGLALFDAAGKTQLAAADGASAATGEARLVYKASVTGDYYVSAHGAASGSYTLAASLGADSAAPRLTASSLADGATGVGLGSKILLSFDDAITAGSGIRLTDEHGATLSSVVITASGNTLKIDPHQNLTPGATYTLSLPEGSVLDLSGNRYAGHASYTFTTVAPASSSTAGNGNDVFSANGTGQKIDGGAGTDTVFYDDTKVPLEIYAHDGQVTVYQTGAGTADTLTGIERLVFPTHAMAFDVDGNGGQAYRLYQAAFNRKPGEGLGFWMNALDVGAKLETVAQNFIDSPEFKTLYGDAPSNADFVTHLYSNVLHRAPLQAGYDFWLHGLDAGATRAQILVNFSESAENVAALQPLIGQGFSYTPYG
ncbi:pre-peptidase C-terminal domain-containing protein [Duganella sp. Dugasp56]|uniref:pre-peptidase C-terminal domain-containing protein n=1 Tax=Duganella sp. Dugasp56 TaxID=3243046 RepID=UPI0039AECD77